MSRESRIECHRLGSSKFSKESETESRVSNRRSNDLNANTFNINLLERVIRGGLEDYIVVEFNCAEFLRDFGESLYFVTCTDERILEETPV